MKHFTTRMFALALLPFVLSCTKDHGIDPKPDDPSEKEKLRKEILGKWVVETSSGRTTGEGAFLEFLSDSTYILYNVADTLVVGVFKATSGTTISLEGFGSVNEIKFASDKISFKFVYSGKTILITAGKSGMVEPGDKTKLLTRNWSLTTGEGGSQLINETTGIDSVTILFTSSQTYLVQFFSKGKLMESGMNNWKWHASDPNRFIYWEDGQDIKEGNYGTVHELNETHLKVTDNADGNPVTFVLIPVK